MDKKHFWVYNKHLSSLTKHMRKYEKPAPYGYGIYATSYISQEIPWKRIFSDDTMSYTADCLPFPTDFDIKYLTVQEKERKARGESVRKKVLIPSSKHILHFRQLEDCSKEEKLAYLYFKAMQCCQLNKALALDEKYPKPDSNALRSTYSKEHQAAVAAMESDKASKDSDTNGNEAFHQAFSVRSPFQLSDKQKPVEAISVSANLNKTQVTPTEDSQEVQEKMRRAIIETLGGPIQVKHLQHMAHWQFHTNKTAPRRPIGGKLKKSKCQWKKNIYPPKTKEEKIMELRKMAPPLETEYLETDHLPGLWQPELMISTFRTSFMEKEEEVENDNMRCSENNEENWWKVCNANRKCLEWLESIPDYMLEIYIV